MTSSRGNTVAVATDQSAVPGLLAEVGITTAQLALQQLQRNPQADSRAPREAPQTALLRERILRGVAL
jgi:hypothetical protein